MNVALEVCANACCPVFIIILVALALDKALNSWKGVVAKQEQEQARREDFIRRAQEYIYLTKDGWNRMNTVNGVIEVENPTERTYESLSKEEQWAMLDALVDRGLLGQAEDGTLVVTKLGEYQIGRVTGGSDSAPPNHPNEQNLSSSNIRSNRIELGFDLTADQIGRLCDPTPLRAGLETAGFNVNVIGIGVVIVYDEDAYSPESIEEMFWNRMADDYVPEVQG